jgi:hypothetical protein
MSTCTPMWVWGYSRGRPYLTWRIQLFSGWMDHLWMDAWPYFPGIKVGKIYLYSSFLTDWWRWLLRDTLRSMIIPELCDWMELFPLAIFFTQLGFIQKLICRTTEIRPEFCTSQLRLWINNQIYYYFFKFKLFKQSGTRHFHDRGNLPPYRHLLICPYWLAE